MLHLVLLLMFVRKQKNNRGRIMGLRPAGKSWAHNVPTIFFVRVFLVQGGVVSKMVLKAKPSANIGFAMVPLTFLIKPFARTRF